MNIIRPKRGAVYDSPMRMVDTGPASVAVTPASTPTGYAKQQLANIRRIFESEKEILGMLTIEVQLT